MSPAAAGLLAGALWLGCLLPGPWPLAVLGIGLLLAARAVAVVRRRVVVAVIALALLGAGLTGARVELADRAQLAVVAGRGGAVEVDARAVSEARATATGAWQILRVNAVDGRPVRERAAVTLPGLEGAPPLGADVSFTTTARPLERDGFDAHLRRLHAVVALDPVSQPAMTGRPGPVWRATNTVRENLRASAHAGLHAGLAPVLTGLVTGDVRGQDPLQAEALRDAGLVHLVVVSGRHVGLLLAGVLGLGALCGLGVRPSRWVALGVLGWFVLLVRWQPSVLRAALMATVVLGARLVGRRADARHALAVVVVVLLLADPFLAGQLGFALSVAATAGVLVAAPWFAERLRGPRSLRLLIAACLGAQLAVAPLLLVMMDGGVPLAAVPANLIAVPAAAAAQTLGIVAAVAAQLSVDAGAAVARLAGPPVAVIVWSAEAFASGPQLTPALLASPVAALLAALLAAVVVARRRAPRLAVVALVVAVGIAGLPRALPPAAVKSLTVTALDVGQGDAVLVEAPAGGGVARLLVDGGPEPDRALRHLLQRRVRRLDAVAVSHPDADHTNGLPTILERLDVGALLVSPLPLTASVAASAHEVEAVARRRGVPVLRLSAGQAFTLGAQPVEVLSPPADGTLGDQTNANSLVLRVGGATGVLLAGDAEQIAQAWLLRRPGRLRSAILKVPHHGGNTNADGFFDAVGAKVAVVSVGADNAYGHPHPDVLSALDGRAEVHRTDLHGTVTVTADAAARAAHLHSCDAATAHLPVHRPRGAAAAACGRRPRGPAASRGTPGAGRPARLRARGGRAARPAHRIAVRRSPRDRAARGRAAARRRRGAPGHRTGGRTARRAGDPAGDRHRTDRQAREARQGPRRPVRPGPAT